MKIIHCADIHIGSVMQNLSTDKSKLRKRELLDTFFRMIEFAKENKVEIVIIAGDLFDKNIIARSIKKEILEVISDCINIDFLFLTGNHDNNIKLEDDDLVVPQNLKRFEVEDDWTYFNYNNICIGGIDIQKYKNFAIYEKLRFDKSKFNIAVMHGDLKVIQLSLLKNKNIDYLALGDIHIPDIEPKKLDNRGIYGYCGCLEGRGYDESGDRGFFLLEIEQGKLIRKFCNITKRKYEIVEVDITRLDNHTKIASAISIATKSLNKENIVRVILKGKYNVDTQKDKENLERKLKEIFYFANVKDESILDMQSVNYTNEISLRNEFINLVNQSNLSEEVKEKIIEYGIKALQGEVIDI